NFFCWNDANASAGAHAEAFGCGVRCRLFKGDDAEAGQGSIDKSRAVEFDCLGATLARDLEVAWGADGMQHGIRLGAGAAVINVVTDQPAAVPVGFTGGGGAAIGFVRDFLDDNLAAPLDGF